MSRTILHKFDQVGIRPFGRRSHRIKHIANTMNDLKIGTLGITTDIVGLSYSSSFEYALLPLGDCVVEALARRRHQTLRDVMRRHANME